MNNNLETKNLNIFKSVNLGKLNSLNLLRRFDTKFILNTKQLNDLLKHMQDEYLILEIENKRNFRYDNYYFDTPDLKFYTDHHNAMKKRFKVRYRKYIDINETFFEIKMKTNKGKTIKIRKEANNEDIISGKLSENMITEYVHINPEILRKKLTVSYYRTTFINKFTNEKITLDTNLYFQNDKNKAESENLAILELKQKKLIKSDFENIIRELGGRKIRISKYVYGTMLTHNNIKYNNFKQKLMQIKKVCNGSLNY